MIALGYITAALTLVLIAITAFYATANWRTMRLLEKDLRLRTKPIVTVLFEIHESSIEGTYNYSVLVETRHAPVNIHHLDVQVVLNKPNPSQLISLNGNVHPTIAEGTSKLYEGQCTCRQEPVGTWIRIRYYDFSDTYGFYEQWYGSTLYSRKELQVPNPVAALWNKIQAAQKAIEKFGNP